MRTVTWLSLILFPLLTSAQIKNIKLDDAGSIQPAIVINKKNPLNIVAATAPDNISYTVDGGATWQSMKAKSSLGVYGDPSLASDDKGNIFSFHLAGLAGEGSQDKNIREQILCHVSKDGGKTWEEELLSHSIIRRSIIILPPRLMQREISGLHGLSWTSINLTTKTVSQMFF